jgi:hypothetical protein
VNTPEPGPGELGELGFYIFLIDRAAHPEPECPGLCRADAGLGETAGCHYHENDKNKDLPVFHKILFSMNLLACCVIRIGMFNRSGLCYGF